MITQTKQTSTIKQAQTQSGYTTFEINHTQYQEFMYLNNYNTFSIAITYIYNKSIVYKFI